MDKRNQRTAAIACGLIIFVLFAYIIYMYMRIDDIVAESFERTAGSVIPSTVKNSTNATDITCTSLYKPSFNGSDATVVYLLSCVPIDEFNEIEMTLPLPAMVASKRSLSKVLRLNNSGQSDNNEMTVTFLQVTSISIENSEFTIQLFPNSKTRHDLNVQLLLIYA